MSKSIGFGSHCVHRGTDWATTRSHTLPIYPTSSFDFDSLEQGQRIFSGSEKGHLYGRFGNPTVDEVAEKLTTLEAYGLDMDAAGIMVSSGMSAISTLMMGLLRPGDKVLTQGNLYGGTTELFRSLLAPLGFPVHFTNLKDLDAVEALLEKEPSIKVLYFETPANPTMACVDMQALVDLAQRYDCLTVADNTFCTPYLQQPFRFGVDFIIHSTTKYLNGHGNSVAGFIAGRHVELMEDTIFNTMKLAGTNCNPWDAWLLFNGLKTLELRMERHSENAMRVAHFLAGHEAVERVNYVGLLSHPDHKLAQKQMRRFGGMLSFELKGGLEAGEAFMRRLQFCILAPTMGDVDTLVMHPASMSHRSVPRELRLENDITDGLIRLSVGIETVEDILGDLEQALSDLRFEV